MELLGWIGNLMLAFCAIPQAYKSWYEGHSGGISGLFLFLWIGGEVVALGYAATKDVNPIVTNYLINIVFGTIIIYYKIKPREDL